MERYPEGCKTTADLPPYEMQKLLELANPELYFMSFWQYSVPGRKVATEDLRRAFSLEFHVHLQSVLPSWFKRLSRVAYLKRYHHFHFCPRYPWEVQVKSFPIDEEKG